MVDKVNRENSDLHASLFFMFVSLFFFPLIQNYIESARMAEISPRFWPSIGTSLLLFFSIVALVRELIKGERPCLKTVLSILCAPKKQYAFLAMAALYIKSMEFLGFILSSLVALPIFLFYFGCKNKLYCILGSIIFVFAVNYCFSEIFKISFPKLNIG